MSLGLLNVIYYGIQWGAGTAVQRQTSRRWRRWSPGTPLVTMPLSYHGLAQGDGGAGALPPGYHAPWLPCPLVTTAWPKEMEALGHGCAPLVTTLFSYEVHSSKTPHHSSS